MPDASLAIIFSKCTGLNDSAQTTGPVYLPDGTTDIIGCSNMTVTPEGKLVKVPALSNVLVSPTAIDVLTAGTRMFAQTGVALKEFNGAALAALTVSPVFVAGVKGKYIHTPIDVRIAAGGIQSKILNSSTSASVLALGTNSGPVTSIAYAKMPTFLGGFVHGAKLYCHNGKFLQFSKDYAYDLWDLGNGFIPSNRTVMQSGRIPNCIITTHSDGVTVYVGGSPGNYVKNFYPCQVIDGTLFSGFVSKAYDHAHVFLCNDGVYIIDASGKVTNLTVEKTEYLNTLNTAYNSVVVVDGKYLAHGNALCVEYDFQVKALMLRGTDAITTSCVWNNKAYFGSGVNLATLSTAENTETKTCEVKFPYNNFEVDQTKQIRFLYLTGTVGGSASVTVRNQHGDSVTKDISNIGYVQNYKVTGLRPVKGNKLSVEIQSLSGAFKIEELRVAHVPCSRRC